MKRQPWIESMRSLWREAISSWRTLVAVTLITVLVWLFAEAQSLTTATEPVRVSFIDPLGERVVSVLSDGWTGAVRVEFEGSAAAVHDASRWVDQPFEMSPGRIGFPEDEGEQSVDLRLALGGDPRVKEAGLRVVDVEPPTVRVDVEAVLELADVEIRPELEGLDLAEPALVDPPRVVVKGPRSVIERLGSFRDGPYVVARLSPSVRSGLKEGVDQSVETTLELPMVVSPQEKVWIEIRPAAAKLSLMIRSRTATIAVPSAPVWVQLPPSELDRWRIEIEPEDQILTGLKVTGPSGVVAKIADGSVAIIAVLTLTDTELEARITSKQVTYWRAPKGVSVLGADAPIRFTILPRQAPEPASKP